MPSILPRGDCAKLDKQSRCYFEPCTENCGQFVPKIVKEQVGVADHDAIVARIPG